MAAWLDQFNSTWLLYALVVSTTAFPILYAVLAPWYRTWLGRAVMTLGIALALLVDLTVVFRLVPLPHLVTSVLTTFVFSLVLVASVAKSVILICTQTRYRPEGCTLLAEWHWILRVLWILALLISVALLAYGVIGIWQIG